MLHNIARAETTEHLCVDMIAAIVPPTMPTVPPGFTKSANRRSPLAASM